jgi:limonene-1,2-epoxide hydrolase
VLTERVDDFEMDGQVFSARVMGAFEVVGDKLAAWRDYFVLGGETQDLGGLVE